MATKGFPSAARIPATQQGLNGCHYHLERADRTRRELGFTVCVRLRDAGGRSIGVIAFARDEARGREMAAEWDRTGLIAQPTHTDSHR